MMRDDVEVPASVDTSLRHAGTVIEDAGRLHCAVHGYFSRLVFVF